MSSPSQEAVAAAIARAEVHESGDIHYGLALEAAGDGLREVGASVELTQAALAVFKAAHELAEQARLPRGDRERARLYIQIAEVVGPVCMSAVRAAKAETPQA